MDSFLNLNNLNKDKVENKVVETFKMYFRGKLLCTFRYDPIVDSLEVIPKSEIIRDWLNNGMLHEDGKVYYPTDGLKFIEALEHVYIGSYCKIEKV